MKFFARFKGQLATALDDRYYKLENEFGQATTKKINESEHCWECPAHGSRFNTDGEVLQGPANSNLK